MQGYKTVTKKSKIFSLLIFSLFVVSCIAYTMLIEEDEFFQDLSLENSENLLVTEQRLLKALENDANNALLHLKLGELKVIKGNIKEAEEHYRIACDLEQNNPQHIYSHAKSLMNQRKYKEAESHLIKAVSLAPFFGDAEILLMNVYHHSQKWYQLYKLSKEMLASNNSTVAEKYLSIALTQKTVLTVLEEEVKQSPTADNYLLLSKEYYHHGHFAQAYHAAQNALKIKEQFPKAHLQMGMIYQKLGNYKCAKMSYRKSSFPMPSTVQTTQLGANSLATTK